MIWARTVPSSHGCHGIPMAPPTGRRANRRRRVVAARSQRPGRPRRLPAGSRGARNFGRSATGRPRRAAHVPMPAKPADAMTYAARLPFRARQDLPCAGSRNGDIEDSGPGRCARAPAGVLAMSTATAVRQSAAPRPNPASKTRAWFRPPTGAISVTAGHAPIVPVGESPSARARCRNSRAPVAPGGSATHFIAAQAQLVEGARGTVAQPPAGRSQRQAAPLAVEKRRAQLGFQCANMTAHRAVGHVQLGGSAGRAFQARCGFESTQRIQ